MVDMPLMAATAWAQAHAAESKDPVAFGAKVAQVYLAAEATKYHGCKDTFSELEATILREAGFGEPTPPKSGGNEAAEGAVQPQKPTPPSPLHAGISAEAVATRHLTARDLIRMGLVPGGCEGARLDRPADVLPAAPTAVETPETAARPGAMKCLRACALAISRALAAVTRGTCK